MYLYPRKPLYWLLFAMAATAAPAIANSLAPGLVPLPEAIVNGRAPSPDSPFARSTVLLISEDGRGSCSGTLVARDLIVTAGHCVTENDSNRPVNPGTMVADFSPYYDGREELPRASSVRARAIRLHPAYDYKLVDAAKNPHDVALVRLEGPAKAGYAPATFMPASLRISPGDSVVAAGYGDRAFGRTSNDYKLETFEFEVKGELPSSSLVLLNALRTGGLGQGDSGGPAWVRKNGALYFWGVASSGEGEGMAQAAYENLAAYRDWLTQAAASLGVALKLP